MTEKSNYDENKNKILESVGVEICQALQEFFFEVSGTPNVCVKYSGESFQNKTITGLSFTLKHAYISNRNKLIFCFEPEDTHMWDWAEIPSEKIETIFPSMLSQAKISLFEDAEAEIIESWHDLITVLFDKYKQNFKQEQIQNELRAKEFYANHPLFGRF